MNVCQLPVFTKRCPNCSFIRASFRQIGWKAERDLHLLDRGGFGLQRLDRPRDAGIQGRLKTHGDESQRIIFERVISQRTAKAVHDLVVDGFRTREEQTALAKRLTLQQVAFIDELRKDPFVHKVLQIP